MRGRRQGREIQPAWPKPPKQAMPRIPPTETGKTRFPGVQTLVLLAGVWSRGGWPLRRRAGSPLSQLITCANVRDMTLSSPDKHAKVVRGPLSAVEVGFEPTEGLPPHTLSRRAPSATRRLHRGEAYLSFTINNAQGSRRVPT